MAASMAAMATVPVTEHAISTAEATPPSDPPSALMKSVWRSTSLQRFADDNVLEHIVPPCMLAPSLPSLDRAGPFDVGA